MPARRIHKYQLPFRPGEYAPHSVPCGLRHGADYGYLLAAEEVDQGGLPHRRAAGKGYKS